MGHLPVSNYRWLSHEEISKINWLNQSPTQSTGYLVECNLHVPSHLHSYFDQFPLAPEHFNPTFGQMSPFSQSSFCAVYGRSADRLDWNKGMGSKLCGTMYDKTYYATHYLNLKYYLEKGLVLLKVHRVLAFEQEPFLRDYVADATYERANAKSKAQKNQKKVELNSLYGKSVEIGESHRIAKFVISPRLLNRYASDSRFDSFIVLGESCVIFYSKLKRLELKKPTLIGFCVLEKSKLFMYRHYYDRILPALNGNPCNIVFSDTDSFLIHCQNMSKLDFMRKMAPWSDYSNLPKSHPLHSDLNASIPGFFKDESDGSDILEVIATRSKQYIIRLRQTPYFIPGSKAIGTISPPSAKSKGLPKAFSKHLKMGDFLKCFEGDGGQVHMVTSYGLQSHDYVMTLQEKKSLAICSYDNKAYLLRCKKHSVSYGNIYIKLYQDKCFVCEN